MSLGSLRIYTEGDTARGLGHVARCSAYAEAWQSGGGQVHWVLDGNETAKAMAEKTGRVELRAWQHHRADSDLAPAALVLLDSYSATYDRLEAIAGAAEQAVFIDDHWREYPAGLIVHASPGPRPPHAMEERWLIGPEWQPLRPAFWPALTRPRAVEAIGKVLVVFGASDLRGLGGSVARTVAAALPGATIDLVGVAGQSALLPANVCIHGPQTAEGMRALMEAADVAVSAAGQTIAEFARCATPTIMVEVADNQRFHRLYWPALTGFFDAGTWQDDELLDRVLICLGALETGEVRQAVSDRARAAVDGGGVGRLMQRVWA